MSTKRSREESVSPTCLPTCSVRRPTYEKVALKDRAGPEDVDSALIFGQTMLHGQPALRKDNVDGTWLRHTSSLVCSFVFLSSIVFFPLLILFLSSSRGRYDLVGSREDKTSRFIFVWLSPTKNLNPIVIQSFRFIFPNLSLCVRGDRLPIHLVSRRVVAIYVRLGYNFIIW